MQGHRVIRNEGIQVLIKDVMLLVRQFLETHEGGVKRFLRRELDPKFH
jgi:hypothetical protein